MLRPWTFCARWLMAAALVAAVPSSLLAQGVALSGVGPVNRAMAGAATAAPIDAAGALLWNPATIGGLRSSQIEIGMELLLPTESLSSSIEPGALGGGFPPVRLAGTTGGEPGVAPIPTMAWVHRDPASPWSYGLGMFGIAGFRVNYPSSLTNPVLTPQAPNGLGMGRIFAEADYCQIVPTVSYQLTERLSLGFAPTLTLVRLTANPLFFAAPDDANGDGSATYPAGDGSRYSWGAGFQAGAYYVTDTCWQFGFSVKSPQWSEPVRCNTADELGRPRLATVHFDYPLILSWGMAYTGFERWVLACDVRYFDYSNTAGFGSPAAFDATGRATGLGWKSIPSVHAGVQYQATDRLFLRLGYQYNDNPIGSEAAFFNVASPLGIQHVVSTGLSYQATDHVMFSLAYLHGFESQTAGPMYVPGVGAVPGTAVSSSVSADALGAGITVQY